MVSMSDRNRGNLDKLYEEAHQLSLSDDKLVAAQARCIKCVVLPMTEFLLNEREDLGDLDFLETSFPTAPVTVSFGLALAFFQNLGKYASDWSEIEGLREVLIAGMTSGVDEALESYKKTNYPNNGE